MNMLRYKSDAFRKEFRITEADENPGTWTLEMTGFLPGQFESDTAVGAFSMAMQLVPTLRRDPLYVSKRAGNPAAFAKVNAAKTQPKPPQPAKQPEKKV